VALKGRGATLAGVPGEAEETTGTAVEANPLEAPGMDEELRSLLMLLALTLRGCFRMLFGVGTETFWGVLNGTEELDVTSDELRGSSAVCCDILPVSC
jgi:hypothetical protein